MKIFMFFLLFSQIYMIKAMEGFANGKNLSNSSKDLSELVAQFDQLEITKQTDEISSKNNEAKNFYKLLNTLMSNHFTNIDFGLGKLIVQHTFNRICKQQDFKSTTTFLPEPVSFVKRKINDLSEGIKYRLGMTPGCLASTVLSHNSKLCNDSCKSSA